MGKSARREDWLNSSWRGPYEILAGRPVVAAVNSWHGPSPLVVDIHDGMEVGVQLAGVAERHFEDHVIPGIPGDVWLSTMWEPHGRRVLTSESENVVVVFSPEFLGDALVCDLPWFSLFAQPPSRRPRVTSRETRARVLALGEELRYEARSQAADWHGAARLLVLRLLLLLAREWQPPALGDGGHLPRPYTLARLMPVLTRIHARPDRITLQEAAAMCNLSRAHFALLFRELMGVPFSRFCLRLRLGVVAHQLLASDRTVEDLASRYGFVDGSHLHRAFVRYYGCTPGQYRNRQK